MGKPHESGLENQYLNISNSYHHLYINGPVCQLLTRDSELLNARVTMNL